MNIDANVTKKILVQGSPVVQRKDNIPWTSWVYPRNTKIFWHEH